MNATPRVRSASAHHACSGASVGYPPGAQHHQQGGVQHTTAHDACLCPACHIKEEYFPRRPDGRIVLPQPEVPRMHSEVDFNSSFQVGTERIFPRRTVSYQYAGHGGDASMRTNQPPGTSDARNDNGTHIASDVPARQETPLPEPRLSPASRHALATKQDHHRTANAKTSRKKPYDMLTDRPEPWPRIASSGAGNMRPPSRAASHTGPDRTHSYNTRNASHSRVPSGRFPRPSRYEPNAPREIRLSPSINSPLGLGQNEPTTVSGGLDAIATTPQNEGLAAHVPRDGRPLEGTHRHPRGSRHSSTRSVSQPQPERHTTATHSRPAPDRMVPFTSPREIPASTLSAIPENAGPEYSRPSSSSHRKAQPGYHPSEPLGNVGDGVGSFSQSDPKTVGERSHLNPTETPSGRPPLGEVSAGFPGQGQIVGMIRFQDPLVPAPTQAPTKNVPVKWDSERKRRQGYFSQDEGDGKSPFRHYTNAGRDT